MVIDTAFVSNAFNIESTIQKKQVILKALLEDQGDPSRWKSLLGPALEELRNRHPNIHFELNYMIFPYNKARAQMLSSLSNQTPVDLVSLDQIWLGEFAQRGLLSDLTNKSISWRRQKDWYQSNWDGGIYGDKIYGIWAWTGVRGIWYWKDLLGEANVNPKSLETWNGYVNSAKRLNAVLNPRGIEAIYLNGASNSPDLWYPYLWMMGGEILKLKSGHPTKAITGFQPLIALKELKHWNF